MDGAVVDRIGPHRQRWRTWLVGLLAFGMWRRRCCRCRAQTRRRVRPPPVAAASPAAGASAASAAQRPPAWIAVPRTSAGSRARNWPRHQHRRPVLRRRRRVLHPGAQARPRHRCCARTAAEARALGRRVPRLRPPRRRSSAPTSGARPGLDPAVRGRCNSITSALALGFDGDLCRQTCDAPLRFSPYLNSASTRPYTDLGLRPAMMLLPTTRRPPRR